MKILFIGEDLIKCKSGVVTVMNQILHDETLKSNFEFVTVFTTSNEYSAPKKLWSWAKAYINFLIHLPSCKIVHIHHASDLNFWLSSGMVLMAKAFGKKSILHNHSADFHEFYERGSASGKKRIVKMLTSASVNIVLSKHWLQWYSTIAPNANWIMLQNTIEIPEHVSEKAITPQNINLVYLARLEQRKGFLDLMQVMPDIVKAYPDIKLHVAGQGDVDKANALVLEKGLQNNVFILGHIFETQRNELLQNGHILVFPSYNEGLPMALLEAMSYGLVPITTPVGGIPDVVVSGENGILIQPGNTNALAESIIYLIENPQAYKALSADSYKVINANFNYKNYGKKLSEIYTSVLEKA